MRRQDTALIGSGRCQKEVKMIIGVTLNEALVDDTTRGWIRKSTLTIGDEESLRYPLIYDDYRDFGLESRWVL